MEGMDIEDREGMDIEDGKVWIKGISNILFIVASCHGEIRMIGTYPETLSLIPSSRLTSFPIKNFEKKSVGGAGCGVLQSLSNANLATLTPHFPVDDPGYVAHFDSLTKDEQKTEYQQMLSQLNPRNFSEDNPVRLTQEIIKQYSEYRDLSQTYPTLESIIEQKNVRILLDELGNKLYGRVDPLSTIDLENFTCKIQKGPSESAGDSSEYSGIVMSDYMVDLHVHTGLIFSFVIGGKLKFYNIFYNDEIVQLINDVETTFNRSKFLRTFIEQQYSKKEYSTIHGRKCYSTISTYDILIIAQAIKSDVGIDYVKMVDMSCRVFDAPRSNERSNARRKEIIEQNIYGGFVKNPKNIINQKNQKNPKNLKNQYK
jgi:hypothetical protein